MWRIAGKMPEKVFPYQPPHKLWEYIVCMCASYPLSFVIVLSTITKDNSHSLVSQAKLILIVHFVELEINSTTNQPI